MLKTKSILNLPSFWNTAVYKESELFLNPLQNFLLYSDCVSDRSRDESGTRLRHRNKIFRACLGEALQKLGNITVTASGRVRDVATSFVAQ